MADTFSNLERSIKRNGRWRLLWSVLLSLSVAALAFFLYRRYY